MMGVCADSSVGYMATLTFGSADFIVIRYIECMHGGTSDLHVLLLLSPPPHQKTHAYHQMRDDVPEGTKQRRLQEIVDCFHAIAAVRNRRFVGTEQLVLVEMVSVLEWWRLWVG